MPEPSTRHRWGPVELVAVALAVLGLLAVGIGAAAALRGDHESADRTSSSPSSTASTRTDPSSTAPTSASPTQDDAGRVVVAISVDGLNPDAITQLGRRGAPGMTRMVAEGAGTFNARTAAELTITLPNHTGMVTGRGLAGRGGTSVTFNDDDGGTLAQTHGSYVPSMFDVAHDRGVATALLAGKDKFRFLLRSFDDTHGAPDTTGSDDGRDKIDDQSIADSRDQLAAIESAIGEPTSRLVFWHLPEADVAGHDSGFMGPSYLAAVREADARVASLLQTIDDDPRLRERVTVLLTADHGGPAGQRSHSDSTLLANQRIPFLAWGAGVEPGTDLYELTSGRRDPGDGRPTYDGAQPIRNIDLADTALRLLDLPPIDGARSSSWPPLQLR